MHEGWNVIVRYDEVFVVVNIWLLNKEGNKQAIGLFAKVGG